MRDGISHIFVGMMILFISMGSHELTMSSWLVDLLDCCRLSVWADELVQDPSWYYGFLRFSRIIWSITQLINKYGKSSSGESVRDNIGLPHPISELKIVRLSFAHPALAAIVVIFGEGQIGGRLLVCLVGHEVDAASIGLFSIKVQDNRSNVF